MVRFIKSVLYLRLGYEDDFCVCGGNHLVCSCAYQEAHDFLPSFQPCVAYFEDYFSSFAFHCSCTVIYRNNRAKA